MKFIARYTLNHIKPKILIMENAPQLYTNTGANMREYFKNISRSANYSVMFIKTDTQLHHNCQRRPRTFVMFIRNDNDIIGCPDMINENKHINVKEYFETIDKNITEHNITAQSKKDPGYLLMHWVIDRLGVNWREEFAKYKTGANYIIECNLYDDYLKYLEIHIDDKKTIDAAHRHLEHVKYKLSLNMGYYWDTPTLPVDDHTPAMIFKTIRQIIHPVEDRFISVEEALALMGMPYDFKFIGENHRAIPQIGQNVPVKTAKWVVENALNIIDNWETIERKHSSVCYYNNLKNTYVDE